MTSPRIIGRISDIHPGDAHYSERDILLGQLVSVPAKGYGYSVSGYYNATLSGFGQAILLEDCSGPGYRHKAGQRRSFFAIKIEPIRK